MKSQIFAVLFCLMGLFTLTTPFNKAAAQTTDPTVLDISGTNAFGTFDGTFDVQRFVSRGGVIYASGLLEGTFTAVGGAVTTISQVIQLPVTAASGTCQILHLELGPLDLDLLGLVIHLDKVVLDITAESGPGNLLGNLLCAVAGLLDSGSSSAITRLLNQILGLLG